MRLSLLLLFVLLTTSACRHRRAATIPGPGMNAKRELALLEGAASRLQCSQRELVGAFEASLENYHVYRVDGCGKRFYSLLHCTAGLCKWREAPEMRAETELQCPVTELRRSYAPPHVFTISGCGRQVSYELSKGHLNPVYGTNALPPPMAPPPPGALPPPPSGSSIPPPPPPPPPP